MMASGSTPSVPEPSTRPLGGKGQKNIFTCNKTFNIVRGRVSNAADPDQALKDFIARQKMGRVGTPAEIASIAVHLASDEVIK